MDDPRDRPPQPPGAVPQFMAPQQVTAPLPLSHQLPPWAGYPPPPPPPEPKHGAAKGVAALLGVVLTIATIIFSAGTLVEKLKNIEASRAAESGQQDHRERLRNDRYEKLAGAVEALDKRVEVLTEEVKRARWQRRGRTREAAPQLDSRP